MAATAAVNCLRGFDRGVGRRAALRLDDLPVPREAGRGAPREGARPAPRRPHRGPRRLAARRARRAARRGSTRSRRAPRAACWWSRATAGSARPARASSARSATAPPRSSSASGDAIATLDGFHAVADEIVDVWRAEGDRFVHTWEERFVIQEGYQPRLVEVVQGLLERSRHAAPRDFARVALYAPDERAHAGVARALRLDPARVVAPLFGRLGNAGCAFAPLLLASALEQAKAGRAHPRRRLRRRRRGAARSRATERVEKLEPRRGVAWHLARRRPVKSYDRYLKARSLETREYGRRRDAGLSATIHFRERDEDVSFLGQRCRKLRRHAVPDPARLRDAASRRTTSSSCASPTASAASSPTPSTSSSRRPIRRRSSRSPRSTARASTSSS